MIRIKKLLATTSVLSRLALPVLILTFTSAAGLLGQGVGEVPAPWNALDQGRFVATLSPWVATVDGSRSVVGAVRLEGDATSDGRGSLTAGGCDLNVNVLFDIRMSGLNSVLQGAERRVSPSSRQTREPLSISLQIKPPSARNPTDLIVISRLPLFLGGAQPPPDSLWFWIPEIGENELFAGLRYRGPARLDTYDVDVTDDVTVEVTAYIRSIPLEALMREDGIDLTHMMPAERVRATRAFQSSRCESARAVVTEMDFTVDVPSGSQEPKPEAPTEAEAAVAAEPREDVDSLSLEDVLQAVEGMDPAQADKIIGLYQWAGRTRAISSYFSPACIAVEYLAHIRRTGAEIDYDNYDPLGTTPGSIHQVCFSEVRLRASTEDRLLRIFQTPEAVERTVDTQCVNDRFLRLFRETLPEQVPQSSLVNRWLTDASTECRLGGGNR